MGNVGQLAGLDSDQHHVDVADGPGVVGRLHPVDPGTESAGDAQSGAEQGAQRTPPHHEVDLVPAGREQPPEEPAEAAGPDHCESHCSSSCGRPTGPSGHLVRLSRPVVLCGRPAGCPIK
ncbi:hypothetical protein SDC9_177920 [bioreactor metagenome]|uniref:Uncharacterized protein n=1 Tax=bioreactor metagenome TaxID=1076179 RepID=A0A645GXF8_9ZZZZ